MNLVRATATIGGLTLVSRVLGFVRDLLMARFMGAGFASDAFLVAFRLPNLFRALFAEGAFSAVFVPMFSRKIGEAGGDTAPAREFAEQVLAVLAPVLLAFTALALIAAGPVVWAMTGGFQDGTPEKLRLTTEFTRLTFPYLLLISLASLFGGVLNSLGRFWVNAATPVLLNMCLIAGLTVFRGHGDIETARGQAAAVTIAGILQFAWVAWASAQAGQPLRLRAPKLTPQVRALMRVIAPAALGAGASQVNVLISTLLAARFLPQGSVSFLYYADRLNQLPLGLVGVGVGTAILPTLSRALGAGDTAAAERTQNRALELVLLLTFPAAVALVVSALPLIRGLLQHGAFTGNDSLQTARALTAFSLGLPAYVLIKVLTPGLYARSDTRTPVRIAVLSVAVNFVGNITTVWSLAHVGLALSTAVAAWVNAGLLYATLHRRGHLTLDLRLRRSAVRLFAAAVAMAAVLFALNGVVEPYMTGGLVARAGALTLLCGGGFGVYLIVALGLGAFRLGDLRAQFARRRPTPLSPMP
jgi:putative peptidoglycan lipid II flippase